MKKQFVSFILFAMCFCSNGVIAQTNSFVIKGSDTVLPLSQKEAEVYMHDYKKANVTVTGGGSGVGISAFLAGTTDIAMTSRRIKFKEKTKLKTAKKEYKEIVIAYDAIAVVVHPSNPISALTFEQIAGIYTGKITNWKEVGGKNMPIVGYSRETSSGTYEYFKKKVLSRKNFGTKILLMPSNGSIVQSVSQTKGAIGYIGLSYLNKSIKTLKAAKEGNNYVAPTLENATKGLYPVSRKLYYYYLVKNENKVKHFITFVLSKRGQEIAKNMGYVPVNK